MQATKTDVDTILKRFDKDGSGGLDKNEFKEFLKSLNLRLTFLETEAVYDLLNYKQLPTLSREEIYNILLIKGGSGINTVKVIEGFKQKVNFSLILVQCVVRSKFSFPQVLRCQE